ncbi:MAG: choice-of-anchor C family protein [Phycisphaerae bacterium]|nr:choice-of-anchor C family protein [Phycisphaerae bacterium]
MLTPRSTATAWLALLGAAFVSSAALAQNLLINGSFETWPGRVPSYVSLPGGSTAMAGWITTGNTVDLVGGGWQQADGSLSLDLDGSPGPGGVQQTFATIPGQWYTVEFFMAGNPQCGDPVKALSVEAAGFSNTFTFNTAGHSFVSMGWELRSWCFRAHETSTTLTITSLTASATNCGAAIDGVVVEASSPPLVGDLDCNGFVNGADLAILLGSWGLCSDCAVCRSDLNGDCSTDGADLALLLGAWTG